MQNWWHGGGRGQKVREKNGDVIYGQPLSSILEPGGISQWDGIEGFLAPELGFYVLLRHDWLLRDGLAGCADVVISFWLICFTAWSYILQGRRNVKKIGG